MSYDEYGETCRGEFVYFTDETGDAGGVVRARNYVPRAAATAGGAELTDARMQQLADEAEAGYDVERLRPLE